MEKILPPCPVEVTLQLIGDKWKILIIRNLMDGTTLAMWGEDYRQKISG